MTYRVRFTKLAEEFAKAKASTEEVEATARRELERELGDADPSDPDTLLIHTFEVGGADFCCYPRDGFVEIDTVSWEEGPVLDAGPFKGKRVMHPRPDSEGRDD